ncbi:MAG: phosphate ABC transporter permease PstA [Pseudomonadota bacterium]
MNKLARRAKRRAFELAFRSAGFVSLAFAGGTLILLVVGVLGLGLSAFWRYEVELSVTLDAETLSLADDPTEAELLAADYRGAIREALNERFPEVRETKNLRALQALISPGAEFMLAGRAAKDPGLIGEMVRVRAPVSDDAEMYLKGRIRRSDPPDRRTLTDQQLDWVDAWRADGDVRVAFNGDFLANGDSSYPELAGVAAGVLGSLIAVGLAILIAAPLGVATAVLLEEFAPKNRLTDFLEVNINNLAAVPSIVFGLLGLAAFVVFFGMPRSAPLVGGIVLSLMTLPTIIISSRAALRALPQSLKEGALALGASRLEAVVNPMLPAAAPGIITGVIIGFAQALGETAPLLLIGMVSFVATPPTSVLDPSSALPVLVYLWAESPEIAFVEKTAGAVIVLLSLLLLLNAAAAYARRRFDPYQH